jgi:release factor glutamine methyltransferase
LKLHERLAQARAQLNAVGIPNPEAAIDVDLFARTILGWDRARLIVEANADMPPALEPRFSEWIDRCARHEPASYIVGEREFWGLDFLVNPAVLIPRPESEFIVEEVLAIAGPVPPSAAILRIADLGTGSGCIGVAIAHSLPNVHVVATDISAEAVAVARQNAARHGVDARMEFYATSYLGGIEGDFDIIATNPPYVRELDRGGIGLNVRHEPEVALYGGDDGLLHIAGVLDTAVQKLRPHGWLVMEIGLGQEDDVSALVAARPSLAVRRIRNDLQGIARTFVIQKHDGFAVREGHEEGRTQEGR